jgi:dethiobiotin synthetase
MTTCRQNSVIFITGTDTGVGKTVLTGLLLRHLRLRGCHALAMKPFCSGGLGDARALRRALGNQLTLAEICPFAFQEPLAPLVAARKQRRVVRIENVTERIASLAGRCDVLLVEGAGGLLTPLGEGFAALDLIDQLRCETVLVAANQLGVINHTLLTVRALNEVRTLGVQTVLMDTGTLDGSAGSNERILREMLAPRTLIRVQSLGHTPLGTNNMQRNVKKTQKSIARLLDSSIVCGLFFASQKKVRRKKS